MTLDPGPSGPKPVIRIQQARIRLALASLALGWERAWVRLWVPAAYLGLLLVVALTEVLSALPEALHLALVFAAFIGIGAFAWQKLRTFAWPTRDEARAHLEAKSPVAHRPLTTVEDALPPGAEPAQQLLWELHQKRAREDLAQLRVALPAPGVAKRDPWAARAVVVLLLFVAFMGGWSDVSNRLMRAVVPSFGRLAGSANVKLWITPPAYTRRAPIYVELPTPPGTTPSQSLEIPAGSTALAVVLGAPNDVFLTIGETSAKLERLADSSRRGETPLTAGNRLELHQNKKVLAGWDVKWIKDNPPTIKFAGEPATAKRWQLKIDYSATDDYGVQDVTAHMTLPANSPSIIDAPTDFALAAPPFAPLTVSQTSLNDLAAHPWAGMSVQMQLTVTDTAGQAGKSEIITLTLPERVFGHPVAQELAKQRKALLMNAKSAAVAETALSSVTEILKKPEAFGGDALAHLAISASKYRLGNETREIANRSVPSLLWHAAVRIEDGNLTVAEQRLRTAQKSLRDAIQRGASQEELNRLTQELKDALGEFAKAQNDAKQDGSFSAAMNKAAESAAKTIDQLRDRSEYGSKADVEKAFEQLEQQLQDLDQKSATNSNNETVKAAQEMLKQMQDVATKQSKLLNETFDQSREQEKREQQAHDQLPKYTPEENAKRAEERQKADKAAGQKSAAAQEQLRNELGALMQEMQEMTGKPVKQLQDADKSMTDARDALKKPSFKEGSDAQSEALSQMEKGSQDAADQMAQMLMEKGLGGLVQMPGQSPYRFSGGTRTGRSSNGDVDLPEGPEVDGVASRVRTILEEIRARAGDRTRSSEEQDYLHRLMKKF